MPIANDDKTSYDETIASTCLAQHSCKQHRILCSATCPLWIDIRYQTSLSGIPKRFSRWTIETLPDDTEHLDVIRRYCDDQLLNRISEGKGLYLWGGVGSGKTSVASAIAQTYIVRQSMESLRRGERSRQLVAFINVPDLLDEIRQSYSDDDKRLAMEGRLTALTDVPLVIMDDIGAERGNEWTRERLLTILGARYDNERCTFFTSNLALAELKEALGPRLASRIEGMSAPVKFVGSDRRRKI